MKTEVFKFLIVGVSAVLVDYIVYSVSHPLIGVLFAKVLSFVSGSSVSYIANKLWTFNQGGRGNKDAIKFFLLYMFTLLVNVFINWLVLFYFYNAFFISFLCATGASTVLNFLGMKFWVFKEKK